MLRLQAQRTAEPAAAEALEKAMSRVMAVAEAHRSLYRSSDLRTVDLCRVLTDLTEHLGSLSPKVAVRCASHAGVNMDAERGIPIGLIASELLSNAIKHAYPDGGQGAVEATVEERDGLVVLTVEDGGRGMPLDSPGTRSGLGSALVRSLARQVGARVSVESCPGRGTKVRLTLTRESDPPGPEPHLPAAG
ncbi:sensor histidine kinase [Belnapia arida]|uniref:sensor histidine kinase n=1 Tax=Belnapia arida TaxID=2804533 RepID=UPI0038B336B3